MKMIIQFCLILLSVKELYCGGGLTMAEGLFGKTQDPNCSGDCKLVDRYLSIFPLRNEQIDGKTQLTEMTYKVLMFTTDNLIIFDSDV